MWREGGQMESYMYYPKMCVLPSLYSTTLYLSECAMSTQVMSEKRFICLSSLDLLFLVQNCSTAQTQILLLLLYTVEF